MCFNIYILLILDLSNSWTYMSNVKLNTNADTNV